MAERFQTHLFTYTHDGGQWVLEIQARDAADAKARLAKLQYARYDGVLMAKLPARTGWLVPLICAVRNLVAGLYRPGRNAPSR